VQILIVSATDFETSELKSTFQNKKNIHFISTGVGMAITAYTLTKEIFNNKYDLIINTGIAGAFNKELTIGEVTAIEYDFFAELGAENDRAFIPFPEMNLKGVFSFQNYVSISTATYSKLKKVKGATVNTVHGNENSINHFLSIYEADIESMEGASVAMVCEKENVPYLQIRSISNYVTKRNTKDWNIQLAISNLNSTITKILNELDEN
jgi:futalosine hydrolase